MMPDTGEGDAARHLARGILLRTVRDLVDSNGWVEIDGFVKSQEFHDVCKLAEMDTAWMEEVFRSLLSLIDEPDSVKKPIIEQSVRLLRKVCKEQ